MNIAILKEASPESRVAATPELVQAWITRGHRVWVETGAGSSAAYPDEAYQNAGAQGGSRTDIPNDTEVLVTVNCPAELPLPGLRWLIGTLSPARHRSLLEPWAESGLTILSLDALPRITRAQNMDVLSSQASLGGYHAVVEAAALLPRCFPMMMTAAGTVVPARVLVIGAGVAGLQAIATAKRLGAVVAAFDTRPSVKEQVESLGGQFIEVEGAVEDRQAGGYAVEQSEDYRQRQQERLNEELLKADVVITTAQIPGQRAPVLISSAMLARMKAGSVVMDLAAAGGGNCEGTVDGQNIRLGQALVCGRSAPASAKAQDASRMYSKNLLAFTALLETEEPAKWNLGRDEIVTACCLAHDGKKQGLLAS
ncbi:MAG: NAD(P) transhydrogenase subunit alpha [Bacteroidetes bacterium]|nr:NAD(P) transhydrogenase subunit alpha [Bacteroidota bacterium]